MEEDRSWCVIKIIEPRADLWANRVEKFYAMRTKDTSPPDRVQENLTNEEAVGLMKLLRTTQGELK
jgi:hypothetical protein